MRWRDEDITLSSFSLCYTWRNDLSLYNRMILAIIMMFICSGTVVILDHCRVANLNPRASNDNNALKMNIVIFLRKNSIIVIWQSFRYGFEPSNSWLHHLSFWQTRWIWIRQYWKLLYWKLYPIDKFKKRKFVIFIYWSEFSEVISHSQVRRPWYYLLTDYLRPIPVKPRDFVKDGWQGGYERWYLIETT